MRFVINNLQLFLDEEESDLSIKIAKETRTEPRFFTYSIIKKSVDSRKGQVSFIYTCLVESPLFLKGRNVRPYKEVEEVKIPASNLDSRPVVVGFGPSGMFAALVLARSGAKPIILERGKKVEEREADVETLKAKGVLDPNSNVCYGEGGAGTFSDGKLHTGVNDPHSKFVLDEFVKHGAKDDILYSATPHIGSDILKHVVVSFREEIIALGGDILFSSCLSGIHTNKGRIDSISYTDEKGTMRKLDCSYLLLALGHSPNETMRALFSSGLKIEPKDFSIGVRIEHLQKDIDILNYHRFASNKKLPPSSYHSVIHLPNGRAVYSFCNCPGGYVVNSSSSLNEVLTNGMSNNARDAINGNSAMLVNVKVDDYFHGSPLDGFEFRNSIERKAFCKDKPYFAPIETLGGFLDNDSQRPLGKIKPSYEPGVYLSSLSSYLPNFISSSLKEAFPQLAKRQSFFADEDALLTGFETRSSSPIRIPRDENGESNILGLYPLGEGASYAGGITSAALDGIKIALKIISK